MFKIAVIQNQSEAQRSGYADVQSNLSRWLPSTKYEFFKFDSSNIESLFDKDSLLDSFDCIFLSTNAMSDAKTVQALQNNHVRLRKWIEMGKGFYFGYQKKATLSASSNMKEVSGDIANNFAFLPERLRFVMKERPADETDSSEGYISISDGTTSHNAQHLLLNSPNRIASETIIERCLKNDFKAHLYRCTIFPIIESSYTSVLKDISYSDSHQQRDLLMVNRSSSNGERIVVSAIAIDWESNIELIENILEYLTAGMPFLAFIHGRNTTDESLKFLESSVRISGAAYRTYSGFEEITMRDLRIHGTFIISSEFKKADVDSFWRRIAESDTVSFVPSSKFKRLYHLHSNPSSAITKYVNYTSLDRILNEAVLWTEQEYREGFWSGGFWNTHDILQMLMRVGVNIESFIPGVLDDISKHLKDDSYDGVMGPTCGLLTLLNQLSIHYSELLNNLGYDLNARVSIAKWICHHAVNRSETARQSAFLALHSPGGKRVLTELKQLGLEDQINNIESSSSIANLQDYIGRVSALSLLDLVRFAEIVRRLPGGLESSLNRELRNLLLARQKDDGSWGSIRDTARVVYALVLNNENGMAPAIEDELLRGIDYLRLMYDNPVMNWGNDFQITSECISALNSFNMRYSGRTRELLDAPEVLSNDFQKEHYTGSSRVDLEYAFRTLQATKDDFDRFLEDFNRVKDSLSRSELNRNMIRSRLQYFRIAFIATAFLLGAVLVTVTADFPDVLRSLYRSTALVGGVTGALLSIGMSKIMAPDHEVSRMESAKKGL